MDLSGVLEKISDWRDGIPLWHPLGFVSLPLIESEGWVLKLHYWPNGMRKPKKPDWPIHNHRFRIESRVLYGAVENRLYGIEMGGEYRLFPVAYSGKDSVLEPSETFVTATLQNTEYHKAGVTYEIPRKVFHQTFVPINTSAMTIVLQTDLVDSPPFVVGKEEVVIEKYNRTFYDKQKLWHEIMFGPK